MRLITFRNNNKIGIGSLRGDQVIPFSQSKEIPDDMLSFLQAGEVTINIAKDLCNNPKEIIALKEVNILSPISRPPKIIAIGLNYMDHLEEIRAAGRNMDTPEVPMIFNKQSLSANGPYDEIHKPIVSDKLDYEGELTIVIGQNCRHVSKNDAHKVIAGYTIANDVSVRDWQMRVPTFTIGKSFDTHCPFGPAIVTKDEITDPHNLNLRTEVNGEIRQESNTKHLIFNCFELIEHISTAFTLEAGDLILTGTPSGVGVVENKFLKASDVVKVTIDTLGYIENKVINEVLK
ncbi:MAG: fumarylacetoacetate hydrolase family protein [Pseudomonadota bacterium]|nr:fumarylacetoacetate hydrolase family protein [Pseudomonadota bacterium]MEC7830431.1 fumarylacetoacetate hydrolase family protein [Pseudomonadota bacterium]MEC9414754.1 fumarylacetoacetate hydrolase family protein [Pseudomonadota bacterium]